MYDLPPLDYLQKYCRKIHFFGLGFIQIKINDTLRFHFYTGKLENVVDSIHTHRYNFESWVLKGFLHQEVFQPIAYNEGCRGKPHTLDSVSCQEGGDSKSGKLLWTPMRVFEGTLKAGSRYTLPSMTYHRVKSDFAITKVEVGSRISEYASVLRPVGEEPKCPFSKVIPVDTLWEIVEDMLSV